MYKLLYHSETLCPSDIINWEWLKKKTQKKEEENKISNWKFRTSHQKSSEKKLESKWKNKGKMTQTENW